MNALQYYRWLKREGYKPLLAYIGVLSWFTDHDDFYLRLMRYHLAMQGE